MATAKMETSAERYRRLKTEKEVIEDAECPDCGMVWKAKRAKLDYWVASGILPSSLAAVIMEGVKKKGLSESDVMSGLNLQQFAQSVEFQSKVVRYTAVEPKIVETPTEPNDIGYDEVMSCCYTFLRDWQMTGGGRAASLENFRKE